MPLFSRPEPAKAPMRASAVRLDTSKILNENSYQKRIKDWQDRVFRFSDMIPEVSSAGKFVENSISRVTWEPVFSEGQELKETEETTANLLVDTLRTLDAGRLARMLFTVGEGYCVVTPAAAVEGRDAYKWWNPTGEDYYWRTVSIKELVITDGQYAVRTCAEDSADTAQKLLQGQEIYRVWTPDQQFAFQPWSSHRAMLEILEAMTLHTIADKIFALSVVANAGILYIPNDDFLPEPFDNTGAPLPGTARAFDEEMNEAMSLALSDASGTQSISPLKIYGGSEHSKGLKHLLLDREDNAEAYAARMNAYRNRYATGVDLPAEVVTGIADSNHWSSWKVDQNTWTYHLAPMAWSIADAIVEAWLIPKLQDAKVPQANRYQILPNGRDVVSKPDNTPTILRLLELQAILPEAALNALDMPVDWANNEYNPVSENGKPSGPEYDQQKQDTQEPPTRTTGDNPPAVKTASAAPGWTDEVVAIETQLYERVLEEMRRASTRAVTLSSTKTADATQTKQAVDAALETGISATILALLQKAAEKRMHVAQAESLSQDYLRERDPAMRSAADYAGQYIALLLAGRLHRQSVQNPDGSAVPSDYVPPIAALAVLSVASGGDPASWDDALLHSSTSVRPWNADPLWLEQVGRAAGMPLGIRMTWERGHPVKPFPEHVELQGVSWTNGESNPTLPWFPGDHIGCQCRIVASPYLAGA